MKKRIVDVKRKEERKKRGRSGKGGEAVSQPTILARHGNNFDPAPPPNNQFRTRAKLARQESRRAVLAPRRRWAATGGRVTRCFSWREGRAEEVVFRGSGATLTAGQGAVGVLVLPLCPLCGCGYVAVAFPACCKQPKPRAFTGRRKCFLFAQRVELGVDGVR